MPVPLLPRRATVAVALALPAAAAVPAGARAQAQAGSNIAPADLVRRWVEEVLQPRDAELGRHAHADLVMELHGAGANADGSPRVITGLPAVSAWFEQVKARHASPVVVRIQRVVSEGDTVALLGENVWTLRADDGSPRRRVQTIAAFYTVRDGKIARIVRFTDRVGRAQT